MTYIDKIMETGTIEQLNNEIGFFTEIYKDNNKKLSTLIDDKLDFMLNAKIEIEHNGDGSVDEFYEYIDEQGNVLIFDTKEECIKLVFDCNIKQTMELLDLNLKYLTRMSARVEELEHLKEKKATRERIKNKIKSLELYI